MSSVTLVHRAEKRQTANINLTTKCDLFRNDPSLSAAPYSIRAAVPVEVFREFVNALEGTPVTITNDNFGFLTELSEEFGFQELSLKLSGYRQVALASGHDDPLLLARIAALERQRAKDSAHVNELKRQKNADSARISELENEVSEVQTELTILKTPPPSPKRAPEVALSDSKIVNEFPTAVLGEFRKKKFMLLWRGTEDGFGVSTFHGLCDGHVDTVTLILDISGNIFGGYTPLAWDTTSHWKKDDSGKSFIFTIKNPYGTEPAKFALADPKLTLYCRGNYGPTFGGCDIYVADNSDSNAESSTSLGNGYVNTTGRDGKTFFTGLFNFRAKEIEVFEITD